MVSDSMYIWAAVVLLDYLLFLNSKTPIKKIVGEIILIASGLGAYYALGFTSDEPWPVIVAMMGIISLFITLMDVMLGARKTTN